MNLSQVAKKEALIKTWNYFSRAELAHLSEIKLEL